MKAKRIDFIFHFNKIASKPVNLPQIDDTSPLPSKVDPSDHLAITATLMFELKIVVTGFVLKQFNFRSIFS